MNARDAQIFDYYRGDLDEFLNIAECPDGGLIIKVRGEPHRFGDYKETGDFASMKLPRRIVPKLIEGLQQSRAAQADD